MKGHPLGQALIPATAELLLVDREPARDPMPAPPVARWLPPTEISSGAELAELLARHAVDEVIELAAVGTWDCITACAEAGASYLTTSYDTWIGTELDDPDDARCMLRSRALWAPPDIDVGVHLLCMGMNPGLINLLVARALADFAARTGAPPSLAGLDIHTILLTEIDETRLAPERAAELDPDCFPCTWSPDGCLDEILEPEAMIIRAGEITALDHAPHRAVYEARCGDQTIAGHLVPHEELVSLSLMYPTVDMAYCYRLPRLSEAALAAAPEREPDEWATARLYPPAQLDALSGFNRLGVLLCSRRFGELWIGWQTSMAAARAHATSATLLQVAAGVLAGWHALREVPDGVYLPEELDTARSLERAASVLGEPTIAWDPEAPVRSIADRRR